MTDPEMSIHDRDDMEERVWALEAVRVFLHGELLGTEADRVRHHLHICERCIESFEAEYTIAEMIRRSQPAIVAPAELYDKLIALCLSP